MRIVARQNQGTGTLAYPVVYVCLFVVFFTSGLNQSILAGEPEIYFFTSAGCPPCRQVEPILEELTYQGHRITKIDVRQYPAWVQKFRIQTTPTLVVVNDNREWKRHSGLVDRTTVLRWLQQAKASSATNASRTTQPQVDRNTLGGGNRKSVASISDTVHRGTNVPRTAAEKLALQATVRLRVEDDEGYSYATGTVIHSHQGEWLVLTCGHVFRESEGRGVITAEYDFYEDKQRVPGQLLTYDAGPRDVALVTLKANRDLKPVRLASATTAVPAESRIFSIGCDKGDDPTIRHSRIKNQAKYDGVLKYEIFGRPVVGRSGGGLFNERGELVGVCNAAAVDYDEGIYSSLNNIHYMIAKVDLQRLFQNPDDRVTRLAKNNRNLTGGEVAQLPNWRMAPRDSAATQLPSARRPMQASLIPSSPKTNSNRPDRWASVNSKAGFDQMPNRTRVSHQIPDERIGAEDMEVLVIVRSKSTPSKSETIRLPNPSRELRAYLESVSGQMSRSLPDRERMPAVAPPKSRGYDMRAQSPR